MKTRRISYNERLYLDLQDLTNTYAIQYCFLVKEIKNIDKIEEAINEVLKQSPGVNMYLKGKEYFEQTEPVKIRQINIDDEDVFNREEFREKVPYKDHSLEVLLVKNREKTYLVFRVLHSALDGMGVLGFVRNVMRYLNGEEIIQCISDITDIDFLKRHESYRKSEPKLPKTKIKGAQQINEYVLKWKNIEVPGYHLATIARPVRIMADLSESDSTRIMIPTDIRKHEKGSFFNTNLTLPFFLDIKKTDTNEDIFAQMLTLLKEKKELNEANANYYNYGNLPGFVRRGSVKYLINSAHKNNTFTVGGLISHLGKINLDSLNNPYITFEDFLSLPIQQPLCPLSIVTAQYNNKTIITLAYYEDQLSDSMIDELEKTIKKEFYPKIYENFGYKNSEFDTLREVLYSSLQNHSDDIAVIEEGKEYTYSDLKKTVSLIQRELEANNCKERVCILLPRGYKYMAVVLACIFNGISFVPIDLIKSEEEIKNVIKEAKPDAFITDSDFGITNVKIMKTDGFDNKAITKDSDTVLKKSDYDSEKEVYTIFTSGTTSEPKGVPISLKNISNYMGWAKKEFNIYGKTNMPLFTSLSVDLTMTSVFLPLMTGGYVKAFPEQFSPVILKEIFEDENMNVIKCTPTHISFLTDKKKKYPGNRTLILGGEMLTYRLCESVSECMDNIRICNEYGPTETSVGITYEYYDNVKEEESASIPVGKPVDNTKILLLKEDSVVQNESEIGEIIVSGDSVFKGYSNVEKDCFVNVLGDRYYKTGDLGFIKKDKLYCIGRADSQVKINGNRVELDYIVNTILDIEGVHNSAVIYNKELKAYIVSENEIPDIREQLSKKLPGYMVPSKYVYVDAIPVNKSGKTDFNALEQKESRDLNEQSSFKEDESESMGLTETKDPIEEALNVLKNVKGVYLDTSLSSTGMESVDLILLIQRLREEYLDEDKEKDFFKEVLPIISNVTFSDLIRLIKKFGGEV